MLPNDPNPHAGLSKQAITGKRVAAPAPVDYWRVECSGRTTVTSSTHHDLLGTGNNSADEAVRAHIAAATEDEAERAELFDAVINAPAGEPVALPNGKRLEIIDLGEQF